MKRRGLKRDGTISVPELRDISGRKVPTTEGARLNISILPAKQKFKVVVYKSAIGEHLGYDMVLGAPFLSRYWVVPLYQWQVMYVGRAKGGDGLWVMCSIRHIINYMRQREQSKRERAVGLPSKQGPTKERKSAAGKISCVKFEKPVFLPVKQASRDSKIQGEKRLISVISEDKGSGTAQNVDQPSGLRVVRPSGARKTQKSHESIVTWASKRLRRVRPFEKGLRSRVLPRAGAPGAPVATVAVGAKKPLGIVEAKRLAQERSRTKSGGVRLCRSRMRDTTPRSVHGTRQRLKMMCLMAARQGRNVERSGSESSSGLLEDPEEIVMDSMSEVRSDETRVPVFVAADSTDGGGVSVQSREARRVRLETYAPLGAGEWLFEPTVRAKYARRLIWPTVNITVEEGESLNAFRAPLANPSPRRQWVKQWTLVGYVSRLERDEVISLSAMETYEDYISDRKVVDENNPVELAAHVREVQALMKERVDVKLTDGQMERLMAVFAKHAANIGTVKGKAPPVSEVGKASPFKINTGDAAPVAQRMYRRSPRAKREIDRHVELMERDGIVEPSESSWSSPVVLAMKKDGTTRFCVNYRKLNDVTEKDRYPLPRIDEILAQLGGQAYFTSFDMSAGYWSIPIAESDKKKTAFISHRGLKQFTVMPFGLTNAPAAYQRAMDCVLAGLVGVSCLAYIDDVIIFSSGFENHLKDIDMVLERLGRAGVTINGRKSSVCSRELLYLGHIVTPEGVKPDPAKVKSVQEWLTPTSIKGVRAFLGLVNYYRRYIKDCGRIMKPLTTLTANPRQGEEPKKFQWSEECQNAFESLKSRLLDAPILRHPDFERKFRLDVDSHKGGVGAVLTQQFEDGEHPVAYYSKAFTRDEGKWGSNELEMIGVIKALDHFRPYIWGVDFDLLSDNMGVHLGWLRRQDKGKYARWAARLAEYEGYMTILPRKGRKHGNADGLSRKDRAPTEARESGDDCMGLGVAVQREKPRPVVQCALGARALGKGRGREEEERDQHWERRWSAPQVERWYSPRMGQEEDSGFSSPEEGDGLWALSLSEEQTKEMDEKMDERHKRIWGRQPQDTREETEEDRQDLLLAIRSLQRRRTMESAATSP
jgi:hypothetical protein